MACGGVAQIETHLKVVYYYPITATVLGTYMLDLKSQLSQLKRPKLLVRAASLGQKDYRRKVHLNRVLGGNVPAKASAILIQLCDLENHQNSLRKTRDAAYSAARHVEILIALIAESQRFANHSG